MDVLEKKKSIEHHYDAGNDFYALWLDKRMVYSCALWEKDIDNDIESAQTRKLNWHLNNVCPDSKGNILDIGCGWGSLLQRHIERNEQNMGLGLTLSTEQMNYINNETPNVSAIVESWTDYKPDHQYDGIVSIGAFEHFANRNMSSKNKISLYSSFFELCNQWLRDGGVLSLQTITYKTMKPEDQNLFISDEVFPNSELPSYNEIVQACKPYFEITQQRFDGNQYAKTCDIWLSRLRKNKQLAIDLYSHETYEHYVKYLKYCVVGFMSEKIDLARYSMRKKTN
jgi:cyclopropane-fatty-acyl-phospholipid synthase